MTDYAHMNQGNVKLKPTEKIFKINPDKDKGKRKVQIIKIRGSTPIRKQTNRLLKNLMRGTEYETICNRVFTGVSRSD